MPKVNTIVSTVRRIDTLRDGAVAIHFDNGEVGTLNPTDSQTRAYIEILEELRRMGDPVYVTLDRANVISRLLIPLVVTVTDILTLPTGDLEVQVEPSQARHILRIKDPDAEQSQNVLRRAMAAGTPVVLTDDPEDHTIIDVRSASHPNLPAAQLLSPASAKFSLAQLMTVTPERASQLFELVSNRSCDPITVPTPCIPFLYPDNGCWARAHEMCRLILEAGESVGKCWIYGNLQVNTANHPNCKVMWSWHVAPVLQVEKGAMPAVEVIDPAIFKEPVSDLVWKSAQNDSNATMVSTDASLFLRSQTGWYRNDLTYSKTLKTLEEYRLRLKLRSIGHWGPPPYNCS